MNVEDFEKRLELKQRFVELGSKVLLPSLILFFVGAIFSNRFFMAFSQISFLIGGSFVVIFSHIGWSKNKFIDLIFNQLSIYVSSLGYILVFFDLLYGIGAFNIATGLVLIGYIMVFVGNRLS